MWRGQRYVRVDYLGQRDFAAILLFDINGYIAGLQSSFPQNESSWFPKGDVQRQSVLPDGDRFTATAYFVDPSTICSTGRSYEDFLASGTGTDLYFQMSAVPEDSVRISHKQVKYEAYKGWGVRHIVYRISPGIVLICNIENYTIVFQINGRTLAYLRIV